jgi:cell volume regulation protein A
VAQIGLFVMLGLLVNPHDLLPLAASALVAAAALIFVARPLAALVCLLPFGFRWNEIGFVAWVGLRGAVPIYLAIIPVLQGVPNGELGFAVAFVIVLTSLAVQGWSIAPVARLLRLART